jgi:diacylglycerol kinase (ATP)
MNVDILLNLNVRRLESDTALRRTVLGASAAATPPPRVHQTRTLEELDCTAREIAMRGTDGVVLAGGDGSHMAGVTALSRAFGDVLPPVGIAPCGTVCTVARNFGSKGTARQWTERLVHAACSGAFSLKEKSTLRVRDDNGGQRVGFIFGAGLVASFFDQYYGSSRRGLGAAAIIASRVYAGSLVGSRLAKGVLSPMGCTLCVDDTPHAMRRWSLVLASVVRDVGLHFIVTYRAGERTDRFHVVASGLPPRALGPQVVRVLAGRPLGGEPRIDTLARSLRVRFDEERGSAYVLDGDVFRAGEACVECGPRLPLLVPV